LGSISPEVSVDNDTLRLSASLNPGVHGDSGALRIKIEGIPLDVFDGYVNDIMLLGIPFIDIEDDSPQIGGTPAHHYWVFE